MQICVQSVRRLRYKFEVPLESRLTEYEFIYIYIVLNSHFGPYLSAQTIGQSII